VDISWGVSFPSDSYPCWLKTTPQRFCCPQDKHVPFLRRDTRCARAHGHLGRALMLLQPGCATLCGIPNEDGIAGCDRGKGTKQGGGAWPTLFFAMPTVPLVTQQLTNLPRWERTHRDIYR
jgi:hypothetical protein